MQGVRDTVRALVANTIQILPTSTFDDQIRWDTYRRIYTEDIEVFCRAGQVAHTIGVEDAVMVRRPGQ